jgi:hypothetical protein
VSGKPVSQTITYTFTDSSGHTDEIIVTASTDATTFSGATGAAYAVTSISGSIDGVAITGMAGLPEQVQTSSDGNAIFDNAIFPLAGAGGTYGADSGNTDGIDVYGLEFDVSVPGGGVTEYNLFAQNGTFEFFATDNVGGEQTLTLDSTNAPCFCAGTHIRTPGGEVNVESLKIGDLVTTADGRAVPVRWIGTRVVAVRFADPLRALPIRIKAGALGDGLPLRDLLVSPDHAMYLGGGLIQAGALVNASSIVREANMPAMFTYYHIETPDHALILAEGAPAETFIDNVDRLAFDNWAEHEILYGNSTPLTEMPYARAKSARQVPKDIRAKLDAMAVEFAFAAPGVA